MRTEHRCHQEKAWRTLKQPPHLHTDTQTYTPTLAPWNVHEHKLTYVSVCAHVRGHTDTSRPFWGKVGHYGDKLRCLWAAGGASS